MSNRFAESVLVTSVVLSIATLAQGCAVASDSRADSPSHSSTDPRVGRSAAAVIGGVPFDSAQDAVVMVIHYGGGGGFGECTGTMLAPNLVLTARHCVADTAKGATCIDGKRTGLEDGVVHGDYPAKTFYVFAGRERPDFSARDLTPDGQGKKLFTTGSTTLCNDDIALILLAEPITNSPIAQIRLDGPPAKGEKITSVGWGVSEKARSPAVRQQRTGIEIEAVGKGGLHGLDVSTKEFAVGESICQGDSGGPGLAEPSGAVLGVVSRGGNGKQATGTSPSLPCIGASNLYTQVAPFKELILGAYAEAGYEAWLEGQPDPRLAPFGGACGGDGECPSNVCLSDGAAGACTQSCDAAECPEGFECMSPSGAAICTPKKPAAPAAAAATNGGQQGVAGCRASPGSPDGPLYVGLFFATFAMGGVMRRARREAHRRQS